LKKIKERLAECFWREVTCNHFFQLVFAWTLGILIILGLVFLALLFPLGPKEAGKMVLMVLLGMSPFGILLLIAFMDFLYEFFEKK